MSPSSALKQPLKQPESKPAWLGEATISSYLPYCGRSGRWYWLHDGGGKLCGKRHLLSPVSSSLEVTFHFFHWSTLLSDVKCIRAQCRKPAGKGSPFPNKLEEVSTYLIHSSKPLPAHVAFAHTCTELWGSQQAVGSPQQTSKQKLLIFFNLVMRCKEETRASHCRVAYGLLAEAATGQAYLRHAGEGRAAAPAWCARLIAASYRCWVHP